MIAKLQSYFTITFDKYCYYYLHRYGLAFAATDTSVEIMPFTQNQRKKFDIFPLTTANHNLTLTTAIE